MGSLKQVLFTTTIMKTLSICRDFFCLFICLFAQFLFSLFVLLLLLLLPDNHSFPSGSVLFKLDLSLVAFFSLPFQSQFAYNCNHLPQFFGYILYKLVPRVIALISGKQESIDMKAGSFISCGIYSKILVETQPEC